MTDPLIIRTPTLELVASTLEHIMSELSEPSDLGALLSIEVPDSWPPGEYDRDALEFFRSRLEQDPTAVGWYGWYVIALDDTGKRKRLVAAAGYLGPPSDGVVEIGYSVVPEARGQGYATKAVRALVERAFSFAIVECVCAHTDNSNTISGAVLTRCGFEQVGPGSAGGSTRYELRRSAFARVGSQATFFIRFHGGKT